MAIDVNSPTWRRYYNTLPEDMTLDQCRNHGADHKAYKWSPKIDPRWSNEQKAAYVAGYEG